MFVWDPVELGNALMVAGAAGLVLGTAAWLFRSWFPRAYPPEGTSVLGIPPRVTREEAPAYVSRNIGLLFKLGVVALVVGTLLRAFG